MAAVLGVHQACLTAMSILDQSHPLVVCQPIPLVLFRRPDNLAKVAEHGFFGRQAPKSIPKKATDISGYGTGAGRRALP